MSKPRAPPETPVRQAISLPSTAICRSPGVAAGFANGVNESDVHDIDELVGPALRTTRRWAPAGAAMVRMNSATSAHAAM